MNRAESEGELLPPPLRQPQPARQSTSPRPPGQPTCARVPGLTIFPSTPLQPTSAHRRARQHTAAQRGPSKYHRLGSGQAPTSSSPRCLPPRDSSGQPPLLAGPLGDLPPPSPYTTQPLPLDGAPALAGQSVQTVQRFHNQMVRNFSRGRKAVEIISLPTGVRRGRVGECHAFELGDGVKGDGG